MNDLRCLFIIPDSRESALNRHAVDLAVALGAHAVVSGDIDVARLSRVTRMKIGGALDFISSMRLGRLLKRENINVAVAYTRHHLAALVRARSVAGVDGIRILYLVSDYSPAPSIGVYSGLYGQADAIVFPADKIRRGFIDAFPSLNPVKVRAMYPYSDFKVGASIDTSSGSALFCDDLVAESGIERVIDAMTDAVGRPFERLHVIGTGPGRVVMPLVRKTRELSLPVEWHGAYSDTLLREVASQCAVALCDFDSEARFNYATPFFCGSMAVATIDNPEPTLYMEDEINGGFGQYVSSIKELLHEIR